MQSFSRKSSLNLDERWMQMAAKETKALNSPDFKKLAAYLLEQADGRDRREPWVNKPGTIRPVPKLRIALEMALRVACYP